MWHVWGNEGFGKGPSWYVFVVQESLQFATSPEDWLWTQSQTVAASIRLTFLERDLFESSVQMAAILFAKCVKNMYLLVFLRTHKLGSFFPCIIKHNTFVITLLGNQSSAWSQRIMVKAMALVEQDSNLTSAFLVQYEISDRGISLLGAFISSEWKEDNKMFISLSIYLSISAN